jgi:ADP-ribose pyrophosphatase YjhB (NUDIX family)
MEQVLRFNEFNNFSLNENKLDKLSGIVLIVDNRILLVKPKKYKGKKNMWSIPKGHLEENLTSFENAKKELVEESGIILENDKVIEKSFLNYKKKNILKSLEFFVIKNEKEELNLKLKDDYSIPKKYFKEHETHKAKFCDYDEALSKIEYHQVPVLDYLDQK